MYPWLKNLINIVLPPRCLLCGKILSGENGLCGDCFSEIKFIGRSICHKCGHPQLSGRCVQSCPLCTNNHHNFFRFQRSYIYYDEQSRPLLVDFKFHDKTENAELLAKWLYQAGNDIWQQGADILMPVPLHRARLRYRKYNQSALLCKELAKMTKLPIDYTSLIRIKNTKPQVEFDGKNRKRNVKNAFIVKNVKAIKGKRIVLIDDIMTTGSTLKECAETLIKAGAESVDALTVARVIKS